MKKTIILLFAMCIAFSCAAQTFTITQLKGCKWVTYDREKETNTIWFTDSTYYDESFYPTLNKTTTIELPFYLSNTIEKVFDESKVGTNTSGKYLIIKEGNLKSATLLKSQSVAAQTAKNAIFLVWTDFLPCVG